MSYQGVSNTYTNNAGQAETRNQNMNSYPSDMSSFRLKSESSENRLQGYASYVKTDNFANNQRQSLQSPHSQFDSVVASDRSKALLFQQKATFDDNIKDLAYMEMIAGSVRSSQSNFDSNPIFQRTSNEQEQKYQSPKFQPKRLEFESTDQVFTMNGNNDKSITINQRSDSPIQRKIDYQINECLTPSASKHYDGVKNAYQQEIEVLKYNLWQCQQQDSSIKPTFAQREEALYQSFSQSPSPAKYSNGNQDKKQDTLQDNTPFSHSKINGSDNQTNILQNEAYLMLIQNKTPSTQQTTNQKELYKNDYQFNSSPEPLPRSYPPTQVEKQASQSYITPLKQYEQQSPMTIEEEIEHLKRENEILKQNLLKKPEQNKISGGKNLFSQQNQPINPYKNCMLPSNESEATPIQVYKSQPINNYMDNENEFSLSPIPRQDDAEEKNNYYQQDQYQSAQNYNNGQNDPSDISPYAKLSYYDRMIKIREDRQKEQEQLQNIEQDRSTFQKNVLRRSNIDQLSQTGGSLKSKKFQTPTKGIAKKLDNKAANALTAKRLQYAGYPQFIQNDKGELVVNVKEYMRRVSKYEIDRQQIDLKKLRKEKDNDRTENIKIIKAEIDYEVSVKHIEEVNSKVQKINQLNTLKVQQDKERKEMVRRNQEQLRQALEERNAVQYRANYLSPQMVGKKRSQSKTQRKSSPQRNKEWTGSVRVDGTPRQEASYEREHDQPTNIQLRTQFNS